MALSACQRPEELSPPPNLLPREQMVALLVELQLLESRVENSRLPPDSSRALYLAQQKAVFGDYWVSDSVFQRSYRYYSIHGKDLDGIYGTVLDSLERRKARLKK